MAYKVAGLNHIYNGLKDRMTYLHFLGDEPYRYLEYRLDNFISSIKNIINIYILLIGYATDLKLCYKLAIYDEFIKIDLSLPECDLSSDIYVSLEFIESHIIKSINNHDINNNTNIIDQLNQLDSLYPRCIIDTKTHQIEIFESTREYINYHEPLNHIYFDISVDRTKI